VKRLTNEQIQFWQLSVSLEETRHPYFEACNMYEHILMRSLKYYAIEVDFYEAAQEGDKVAQQVCAQARERMEWDLSHLIWRNYN